MPFIGTQPDVGGYSVLDALTASATASYTLQKNSANFSPSSANQLLVSLNGVIQKPGSSFTVSGSTLTFSSALSSSDSIDFILAMGEPLLVGTPSDGAVNTTQLATNAVSSAKIASSAVTDAKIAGMTATKLTGDLPIGSFPAGTIIQVVRNIGSTSYTNSSSSSYVNIADINTTITPKAANSILLFQLSGNVFINTMSNGQTGSQFLLKDHTNSTTLKIYRGVNFIHVNNGGVSQTMQSWCFNATTSASNTNAREYRLDFKLDENYNNANSAIIGWNNDSNSPQAMVIYEIAQ